MTKYTKEFLEPVVQNSKSWAEVCRKIGIKPFTGAQTYLKKVAIKIGISYIHFLGKAYNRGKTSGRRIDVHKYLTENSNIGSHKLKLLLFRDGVKEKRCENCNLTEWLGKEIPLELHHINGNNTDNRIENLKIDCSNCHSIENKPK
jgi:hypothetical protein